MRLKLVTCFIGIACASLWLPTVSRAEGSWIINRSHVTLTVSDEGALKVHETVTVNFAESRKTGIQRQIPLRYSIGDQVWFAEVSDLKVQRNQVDEPFVTSGDRTKLMVDVGDDRLDLTGEQLYTFDYMVKGALRHNGKTDLLYLNTTGGWETTVEQATAIVTLPKAGLSGQKCAVLPDEQDKCQSVGLSKTESRYVAADGLRPNASMYVQADFSQNLVPIETVRPPSLIDWIEVYRQPLLILSAISTISLLLAGILWLKARKIGRLAQNNPSSPL